jgi:hypothetical protein
MATPHAAVSLQLNVENPLGVVDDLMVCLNDNFLKAKSTQVHLVGSGIFEKIGTSVDGGVSWPKDELPAVLPGEREVPETPFTSLERPDDWLTIPRDSAQALEWIRVHSEKSAQLWESRKLDDDVF